MARIRFIRLANERGVVRPRDVGVAVLTGLVVAMFGLIVFAPLQTWFPGPDLLVVGALPTGLFLLVTTVTYRKRTRSDGEKTGRSIWDAIPSWQYTGRHVESGGITVDGQERALEDVQEQAEERREG